LSCITRGRRPYTRPPPDAIDEVLFQVPCVPPEGAAPALRTWTHRSEALARGRADRCACC